MGWVFYQLLSSTLNCSCRPSSLYCTVYRKGYLQLLSSTPNSSCRPSSLLQSLQKDAGVSSDALLSNSSYRSSSLLHSLQKGGGGGGVFRCSLQQQQFPSFLSTAFSSERCRGFLQMLSSATPVITNGPGVCLAALFSPSCPHSSPSLHCLQEGEGIFLPLSPPLVVDLPLLAEPPVAVRVLLDLVKVALVVLPLLGPLSLSRQGHHCNQRSHSLRLHSSLHDWAMPSQKHVIYMYSFVVVVAKSMMKYTR